MVTGRGMADDKVDDADGTAFTIDDAEAVFQELGMLEVGLDDDPLVFGPKRLNSKVANVRRMLARCERIFLEVSQRLYHARRDLRVITTTLDMAKKSLFANDPETRAGRSVADRDAIAAGKLAEDIQKMHALDVRVADLEAVLVVTKSKRSDLKDTEGRLRDQIRLCNTEIVVGHQWGSRLPPNVESNPLAEGKAASDDAHRIADIIKGVDNAEIHLPQEKDDEAPEEDSSGSKGGVDPEITPETKTSLESDDSSIADDLPATTTTDKVNAFLGEGVMTFDKPDRQVPVTPEDDNLAVPEENLMEFLRDFEKP